MGSPLWGASTVLLSWRMKHMWMCRRCLLDEENWFAECVCTVQVYALLMCIWRLQGRLAVVHWVDAATFLDKEDCFAECVCTVQVYALLMCIWRLQGRLAVVHWVDAATFLDKEDCFAECVCTVQVYALPNWCIPFCLLQACETASALFTRATVYLFSGTRMEGVCVCVYVWYRAMYTCMYVHTILLLSKCHRVCTTSPQVSSLEGESPLQIQHWPCWNSWLPCTGLLQDGWATVTSYTLS